MEKVILCIGTADSKGPELDFLRQLIDARPGFRSMVMDISCRGDGSFRAEVTPFELARLADSTFDHVRSLDEAGPASAIISLGACRRITRLYDAGEFDAVLAIGGGMGSEIASSAMRHLPTGVPKLMVSSQKIVQAGIRNYVGTKDILVFPSPVDIAGLNFLSKDILGRAAGAVIGMLEMAAPQGPGKPLIFMTMTGLSTGCGLAVQSALESSGFEVVIFPAIGIGGETLEEMIAEHPVECVIELALNELGNELFGGMASAGPRRLEAAGQRGIPQIVTPGCVEIVNFLSPDTVSKRFQGRPTSFHNPQATVSRLNAAEMSLVGIELAKKLNQSTGPVEVLLPVRGFSALDKVGMEFFDPDADQQFIDSLGESLQAHIRIIEVDAHINDLEFAEAVTDRALANIG